MKKIFKSRIFIVIICGIIFTSLGVYGANNYKASEISYNPSNGKATNVSEALNELYNSINNNLENTLYSKVNTGDYILMTPTNNSYVIPSGLTGSSTAQTINPSELNLWRVIKKNEDETIEMISEYVSSINLTLYGKTGVLNSVFILNLIANQYENSKYVVDSRIIGYNGQTEVITNTSKFVSKAPWTYNTKDNSNETLGGGDIMYEADTNLVSEILGTLVATTPSGTTTGYYLGSRYYYYNSNVNGKPAHGWINRIISTTGELGNAGSYDYVNDSWHNYTKSFAIRPILTLKSGLTATGSGTSEDPWVLE